MASESCSKNDAVEFLFMDRIFQDQSDKQQVNESRCSRFSTAVDNFITQLSVGFACPALHRANETGV
jgi:hypothetical protein